MFWKDINVYRTGGTAQGIRSKDLVKVMVPIPPIEQQIEFVRFVHKFDKSEFVERFLELSLFYGLSSPLNSEMICIFPYF